MSDSPTSPAAIRWSRFPARQRPARLVVALAVIVLTVGWLIEVGSWVSGLLGGIFLLALNGSFLFPSRYTLDEDRVGLTRLGSARQLALEDVRRWVEGPSGALLSPYDEPTVRDHTRGLVLLYPRDSQQRAAVRAQLRARLGQPRSPEAHA